MDAYYRAIITVVLGAKTITANDANLYRYIACIIWNVKSTNYIVPFFFQINPFLMSSRFLHVIYTDTRITCQTYFI